MTKPPKPSSRPQQPGAAEVQPLSTIRVVMASPEIGPFAKTGGLSDVLNSLPGALGQLGVHTSLIMPAYRSVMQQFPLESTGIRFRVPISNRTEEGMVLQLNGEDGNQTYFVRADKYFDRDNLYGTPEGDYADNAERFIFFSRAILEVLRNNPPQILHAHDWQSALAIAFLRAQPELYPELAATKTVQTIHNLGYQGLFPESDWRLLDLNRSFYSPHYFEFYGKINFLKSGIVLSNSITTVSPTYAEEIKTPENGFGLDGVFRERADRLVGIMNGIDYTTWNPESDKDIAAPYGTGKLSGKKTCKGALQRTFSLPQNPEIPVVGMVSRLVDHKGIELLAAALPELLSMNIQLVIVGTGEKRYHELLTQMAAQYPAKLGVRLVFDEALSHQVIAGADVFLMPSRYEPGGLTQMYAMRYGTIPVVRATGGLKDSVREFDPETKTGNGIVFGPYAAPDLLAAVQRAIDLFRHKTIWTRLMKNAMSTDFSWDRSAHEYLNLYRRLLADKQ